MWFFGKKQDHEEDDEYSGSEEEEEEEEEYVDSDYDSEEVEEEEKEEEEVLEDHGNGNAVANAAMTKDELPSVENEDQEESIINSSSSDEEEESVTDEDNELVDAAPNDKEQQQQQLVEESLDDDEEEDSDDDDDNESASSSIQNTTSSFVETDDEDEQATSMEEKQSLLALATEHDRVDILKAILTEQESEDRDELLNNPDTPPLHVAIFFGSTHATSCLLRMGANPAIRPSGEADKENNPIARYQGVSAWELAFGTSSSEAEDTTNNSKSGGRWSLGGMLKKSESSLTPVDMAPSKREGIRHAFTAEALRCIGSDEVERLRQLLDSGMPSTIDIGGKTLHGWCVEMGAKACEEITRPVEQPQEDEGEKQDSDTATLNDASSENKSAPPERHVMRMLSDLDSDSLANLANRLEELESLARALSTCLDNLAEEVSVCHGLLLLGGGASALASHVRSLKALKERRLKELEEWTEKWSDGEDELAYWVKESGGKFEEIAASKLDGSSRKPSFINLSPESPEEEEAQRQQLTAQIGASENKIRKLRASITDLSEENARDLEEVERRGLSGGIKLVRSLREEIREIEFQLTEAKSGEAACRAHVSLITSRLGVEKKAMPPPKEMADAVVAKTKGHRPKPMNGETHQDETSEGLVASEKEASSISSELQQDQAGKKNSERIATGDSEAIVVRQPGSRGLLPLDLWQILLRIIGLGGSSYSERSPNSGSSNVMIV